ncbi:MAG: lipase family protein [Candidatus Sulfopaludibacter sp.]|nr:lipase family protein [Candidatus Sulfopaludibacter sp.]
MNGSLKNLFFPPEEAEYQYFLAAAGHAFPGADYLGRASWAADAAMLSYARYGARRMDDDELADNVRLTGLTLRAKIGEDPRDWNAPGTQAFLATSDDFAILAFRGTEIDDPDDGCDDLDILLVPEPEYSGSSATVLGHLALVEHLFTAPCLVHRGFQSALNRVWDQVHEHLSRYRRERPDAEICLTGHSLGGALALLTYSRFSDTKMSAFTFGCPRVGDVVFGRRVSANPGKGHYRFVNSDDLVAHVPPESALYRHAPPAGYRFDAAGRLDTASREELPADLAAVRRALQGLPADFRSHPEALGQLPAPPCLVDHSVARYCMRIADCV